MTTKAKEIIKKEVGKQYDRLFKYAHSDSKPDSEQIYTSVKVSEAYLIGISRAFEEVGLIEHEEWEVGVDLLRGKIGFDPLTGEYSFK